MNKEQFIKDELKRLPENLNNKVFRVAISNGKFPYAYGSVTEARGDYADHTVGYTTDRVEAERLLEEAFDTAERWYEEDMYKD